MPEALHGVTGARSADTKAAGAPASLSGAQPRAEELTRATQEVAADLNAMVGADKGIRFDIDSRTDRIIVRVVDRDSGEVIRQVPPDEVLSIIASVNEMLGVFMDERV